MGVTAEPGGVEAPGWREIESNRSTVLHYPYVRLADMRSKAFRSCGYHAAAEAGDRAKVNECFALGFDADVFMAAHASREDGGPDAALRRLWEEHVALPREERDVLLRSGLLRRERAPLVCRRSPFCGLAVACFKLVINRRVCSQLPAHASF